MLRTVVVTAVLLAAASTATFASSTARDLTAEEANRALVIEFYDQFFNRHQVEQAARVVADDYKQHNPDVPDGKAPFVGYFTGYFKTTRNHAPVS